MTGTYRSHRRLVARTLLDRFPALYRFPPRLARFVVAVPTKPEIVVEMAQRLYETAPERKKQPPYESRMCRHIARRLLDVLRSGIKLNGESLIFLPVKGGPPPSS